MATTLPFSLSSLKDLQQTRRGLGISSPELQPGRALLLGEPDPPPPPPPRPRQPSRASSSCPGRRPPRQDTTQDVGSKREYTIQIIGITGRPCRVGRRSPTAGVSLPLPPLAAGAGARGSKGGRGREGAEFVQGWRRPVASGPAPPRRQSWAGPDRDKAGRDGGQRGRGLRRSPPGVFSGCPRRT